MRTLVIVLVLSTVLSACYARDKIGHGNYPQVTASDFVSSVINHPAFKDFGQYVLPVGAGNVDQGMLLNNIDALLPYHSHIESETTARVVNHMISEVNAGKTVFHDLYTDQQKRQDSTKESTGLFFLRGEPKAPFALVCPGGGHSYFGSIHEGFPHALKLSLKGYNMIFLNRVLWSLLIPVKQAFLRAILQLLSR